MLFTPSVLLDFFFLTYIQAGTLFVEADLSMATYFSRPLPSWTADKITIIVA